MMDKYQNLPLDHYMNVVISEDKLIAKLQFLHEDANFHCTPAELEEFLKSHGVRYGIHHDILADIAKETRKFVYNQVTVASGVKPKDGEDGYIRYLFNTESGKKPREMEDGKVDFKEVSSLNNAQKGQLLAERVPAHEGVDGRAVTGEPIPAKKGKEARFKLGKNVVIDQDQLCLYAAIDGLVTMTEKDKVNVFPVYEVNGDVDYSIGNIDFVGNVVVRGSVLTGFRVRAAGDIRIIGGVEGAEVYADGSIEITAGIVGLNKGLVKAKKTVKASFIQDGNVEAGEDVIVTQSIMHSNIRAGRNVSCQGTKGLIVGGIVQAGEEIRARVIGNTSSTVTVLEVGVLPELRNELNQLRSKLRESAENADKTDKALHLLDQLAFAGQLSPDKAALRTRLTTTKKQIHEEIEEMRDRILEIEKSLEDTSAARVVVLHVIYSGCKVVIGRYTRFVKDTMQRITFQMVDGEIGLLSV